MTEKIPNSVFSRYSIFILYLQVQDAK